MHNRTAIACLGVPIKDNRRLDLLDRIGSWCDISKLIPAIHVRQYRSIDRNAKIVFARDSDFIVVSVPGKGTFLGVVIDKHLTRNSGQTAKADFHTAIAGMGSIGDLVDESYRFSARVNFRWWLIPQLDQFFDGQTLVNRNSGTIDVHDLPQLRHL